MVDSYSLEEHPNMKSLNIVGLLSLILLVVLTGCSKLGNSASNGIKENTWYPVGNMINNASFEILVNNNIEQVTFLSLDIPDSAVAEQYDLPIYEFISNQLTASGEVKLSFDQERRNEQGKLIAIVTLKDGTNLNEQLLEMGYAKLLIAEPNIKNENIYKQIEQLAKSNRYGIWSIDTETSNEDVSIREKVFSGISLQIDKKEQLAIIYNYTSESIDLENWVLVSVTGNETYLFDSVKLEPGEKVIVYASKDSPESTAKTVYWGANLVWSSNEKELAELYNKKNELMAVWSE